MHAMNNLTITTCILIVIAPYTYGTTTIIPYAYGYTTWVYTYGTYVPYAYGENAHMV